MECQSAAGYGQESIAHAFLCSRSRETADRTSAEVTDGTQPELWNRGLFRNRHYIELPSFTGPVSTLCRKRHSSARLLYLVPFARLWLEFKRTVSSTREL